jgi:hypothetical protein
MALPEVQPSNGSYTYFLCLTWVQMAQIGADRGLINLYRGGGLRFGLFASETTHRFFRGQLKCAKWAMSR